MTHPISHHPKVFISYSHDSLEHSERVLDLSNRLRSDGIDCILDQYEVSPTEGWPLWTDRQIRHADFVLMVCTETYCRRVIGEESKGIGLGAVWEGRLIYQHVYLAGGSNAKFVPVLLDDFGVEHIPTPLQVVRCYLLQTDSGYEELYLRLIGEPKQPKPKCDEVRELKTSGGGTQRLKRLSVKERKQDFYFAPLTNLHFERNSFFTGREEILRDLHDAFSKGGARSRRQVIRGLGGLGKTQTAVEYAYRYQSEYQAVFWVQADSVMALTAGFNEVAALLPRENTYCADEPVQAVMRWLERNSDWLLIFDNADKLELLEGFRPRDPKGHVLLTSRAQVFDKLGIAKPIRLNVMSSEEAIDFLFTRTGRDDKDPAERMAAEQIAAELGFLPLALEQAGAFNNSNQVRFKDYLAGYRKRRLELLSECGPITGEYPESVNTTWAINFREVENISQAASDLLRASAFLSPDSIPLEFIADEHAELSPTLSAALAADDDPLTLNRVLESLTRYSFIRIDLDSQTYSIHRLMQEVVRNGMDRDVQRAWAERIVCAVNNAFPHRDFIVWPFYWRILPHAKAAASLIETWEITLPEASQLLDSLALISDDQARYSEAELLYKRSLRIDEKVFGSNHQEVGGKLNRLASVCDAQGKYAEAESLSERALKIAEASDGPNSLAAAKSLDCLAAVLCKRRKYNQAESLCRRLLEICERSMPADHPAVANALTSLANVLVALGRNAEASSLYERLNAMDERELEVILSKSRDAS